MIFRNILLSTWALILVLGLAGCGGGGNSPNMELGGINTGDMLDGLLDRTMRTLGSVNSIQSAEAAVPQLKAINDDFDDSDLSFTQAVAGRPQRNVEQGPNRLPRNQ